MNRTFGLRDSSRAMGRRPPMRMPPPAPAPTAGAPAGGGPALMSRSLPTPPAGVPVATTRQPSPARDPVPSANGSAMPRFSFTPSASTTTRPTSDATEVAALKAEVAALRSILSSVVDNSRPLFCTLDTDTILYKTLGGPDVACEASAGTRLKVFYPVMKHGGQNWYRIEAYFDGEPTDVFAVINPELVTNLP